MSNKYWITQHSVQEYENNPSLEADIIEIDKDDFLELLCSMWKETKVPVEFAPNTWRYEISIYDRVSLHNHGMICFENGTDVRMILCLILIRDFLKRPIYLWNDSDIFTNLEISADTTERDVLL